MQQSMSLKYEPSSKVVSVDFKYYVPLPEVQPSTLNPQP